MERAFLLGQDADGDVEAVDQVVEGGAQDVAPVGTDEPELAGERRRCAACRHPHQFEQRGPLAVDRRAVGEGRLEAGDRVAIARALRRAPCRRSARGSGRRRGSRWRPGSAAAPRGGGPGSRVPCPGRGTPRRTGPAGDPRPDRAGPRGRPGRPGSRRAVVPPRSGRSGGGRSRGAGRAPRCRRPGSTATPARAGCSSARPDGGSRPCRR